MITHITVEDAAKLISRLTNANEMQALTYIREAADRGEIQTADALEKLQAEPIEKCKACPLCYSDKQRHYTPPNEPMPVLVNDEPDREYIDYICPRCKDIISQRRRGQRMETVYQCKYHDNCGQRMDWSNPQPYRRPPEGEV